MPVSCARLCGAMMHLVECLFPVGVSYVRETCLCEREACVSGVVPACARPRVCVGHSTCVHGCAACV